MKFISLRKNIIPFTIFCILRLSISICFISIQINEWYEFLINDTVVFYYNHCAHMIFSTYANSGFSIYMYAVPTFPISIRFFAKNIFVYNQTVKLLIRYSLILFVFFSNFFHVYSWTKLLHFTATNCKLFFVDYKIYLAIMKSYFSP